MNQFGHFSLCLAWLLAICGIACGAIAGAKRSRAWFFSAIHATLAMCAASGAALLALGYGFLHDDYTNQYVWQFSNRAMQPIYKISAIWGGMDGSMLLWAFMLAVNCALLAVVARRSPNRLFGWAVAVADSAALFFFTVLVFFTNPFRYLNAATVPPDGNGLNPLLQNPYMAIHPPMLYAGFTTWAIPSAFCLGALLAGDLSNEWLRLTRRWSLVAWGFLTAGIVLGGHWAYVELGWGGFWAWDPVENASFLPWLTGTAFLHSVMVQERKNMLKTWNVWLVLLTYGLTVFGTFLTRSGVVQSVHAFASTDIGWVFLLYLGIFLLTGIFLTWYRRVELRPERRIESFFSREAAFLVNNLLFLSLCFAILWGVLFPVLSEAITGSKQAVGIPYFNAVNIPLFLLLVLLMGIGPLIAWRKASWTHVRRTFFIPFVMALFVAMALVWAGVVEFYPVLSYAICFFVLLTILGEFHRGVRAQKTSADQSMHIVRGVSTLFRRHRNRYGGYVVHLGVLVVTVSITASMAHKAEREFTLAPGERFTHGRFAFTLVSSATTRNDNYESLGADVRVERLNDGGEIALLHPELRFYFRNQETTSEVALRMGPREDLYLVLVGLSPDGQRVGFKLFINPLQIWLWIGAMVMVFGTALLVWPRRAALPATSRAENLAEARS